MSNSPDQQRNSVEKVLNDAGILIVMIASIPNIMRENNDESDKKTIADFMKLVAPKENVWETLGIFSTMKNVVIEQYIKRGLENGRQSISQREPLNMKDIDTFNIDQDDFKITVTLKDLKVHNLSNVQTNKVKSNVNNSTIECAFHVPTLKVTGIYSMIGNVRGYDVKGAGDIRVTITKFDVSVCVATSETSSRDGMQIDSLDLDYNFENIDTNIVGLEVKGISEKELKRNLADNIKTYLLHNKASLTARLSAEISKRLNEIFKGRTSKDLMKLMSDGVMSLFN